MLLCEIWQFYPCFGSVCLFGTGFAAGILLVAEKSVWAVELFAFEKSVQLPNTGGMTHFS